MKRTPIKSSNLKSIGYDSSKKIMEIEFTHGGIYTYQPITQEEYQLMMGANSIGSYFQNVIRPDKAKLCEKVG